jgi:tetratricopeptide (TPR) repeat protein
MTEPDTIQPEENLEPPQAQPDVESEVDVNIETQSETIVTVEGDPGLPDPAELYPQPKKRFPIWLAVVLAVLVVLGAAFGTLRLLEKSALDQAAAGLQNGDFVAAETAANRALGLPLKTLQAEPERGYLLRGQALFQQGRLDEALEDLLTANQTYPQDGMLQNSLTQIYLAQGEMDLAYEAGARAKAIDDSLALPYTLDALKAYTEYRWGDALTAANAALQRGDDSGMALRIRAALELWTEDFTAAGDDLAQAIEQTPEDLEILALRVYLFVEQDQRDEANSQLDELLAISTDSAVSLWAQGLVAYEEYRYDEALKFADQALALEERPEFYMLKASANQLESPEADQMVRDDIDQALALQPDFFPALLAQTWIQMVDYELDDFEPAAQRLEQLAPNAYSTLLLRCRHAARDYYLDEAIAYCDQTIERAPNLAGVHSEAGMVHAMRYEFDAAWEEIDTALALKPDSPSALSVAFNVASMRDENDKAMGYVDSLLETHAGIAWAHAYKAVLLNKEKQYSLANDELNEALQLDPYSKAAIHARITLSLDSEDYLTALNDANDLIKRNPKDPDAYVARGWIYLYDDNLDKARQDANTAISLSKRNPDAYHLLATAYNYEFDDTATLLYAQKSVEVNPYQPYVYQLMSTSNLSIGDFDKCTTNAEKAAELADWDDSLKLWLANAYHNAGKIEEAVAVLDKLMENKWDLDLTMLDQVSTLYDFLKSVGPVVDGKRTQVDTEHKFSVTYPTAWIPRQPEGYYEYEESLFWVITRQEYDLVVDLKLYIFEYEGASQYPASLWATAIRQSFYSMVDGFQWFNSKTFRADGITGTAEEYQYEWTIDDTKYTERGKTYIFVKGDFIYLFEYEMSPYSYATYLEEVDSIVASFSIPE